jgi:hypothetical protein
MFLFSYIVETRRLYRDGREVTRRREWATLDRLENGGEIVITRLLRPLTPDLPACGAIGTIMNNELYAFYQNVDTQDRVSVVWSVCLTMPAYIYGHVDVEAATAEEAAQLALDKHPGNVSWDYEDIDYDDYAAAVLDVECEDPPANAILMCPGRKTGSTLDGDQDQATAAEEQSQPKAEDDGGESCK